MKIQFRKDQIQFIQEEMKTLPEHEKNILKLRFWYNYTLEEIAFIHNLSLSLVTNIFNEAIHRLRLNYLVEYIAPKNSEKPVV